MTRCSTFSMNPPNIRTGIRVDFAVARQRQDQGWNKGRRTVPSTLTNPWSRPRYLRLIDEDILRLLRSELDNVFGPGMHLTGKAGALALEQMVESGRAFWSDDRLGPLQRGVPRNLTLAWKKDEQEYALEISIDGGGRILPVDPAWYLDSDSLSLRPAGTAGWAGSKTAGITSPGSPGAGRSGRAAQPASDPGAAGSADSRAGQHY